MICFEDEENVRLVLEAVDLRRIQAEYSGDEELAEKLNEIGEFIANHLRSEGQKSLERCYN